MLRSFIFTLLIVLSVQGGNASEKCRPHVLLQWMDFHLEPDHVPVNPMSFHDAERAMCTDSEYDPQVFDRAQDILDTKLAFVRKMSSEGRYNKGRTNFYLQVIDYVSKHIRLCAAEAEELRKSGSKVWDKPVRVDLLKSGNAFRFRIFGDGDVVKKDTYSSVVWLGLLVGDEDVHLCEVEWVPYSEQ